MFAPRRLRLKLALPQLRLQREQLPPLQAGRLLLARRAVGEELRLLLRLVLRARGLPPREGSDRAHRAHTEHTPSDNERSDSRP